MNKILVREYRYQEEEVVRLWWTLSVGSLLPANDGMVYRLVFAGYRGGSAGPDVRGALLVKKRWTSTPDNAGDTESWQRCLGDVEFHVHASEWRIHGHHRDPHYNHVILHLVLFSDDVTLREDGSQVPTCVVSEIVRPSSLSSPEFVWPCHRTIEQISSNECSGLLQRAGLLRFEQKVEAFVEQLHALDHVQPEHDLCLVPALAEALGYGRDRAMFRLAGCYLVGLPVEMPEQATRHFPPAELDRGRLRVLKAIYEQWRVPGVWQMLRSLLERTLSEEPTTVLRRLQACFCEHGLSLARTNILICNVILPLAAAVGLLENDKQLFLRAQQLYELHPGLPSNRITRIMCEQLQLSRLPASSCQQQGLQYIYQQTCSTKQCDSCIFGKRDL